MRVTAKQLGLWVLGAQEEDCVHRTRFVAVTVVAALATIVRVVLAAFTPIIPFMAEKVDDLLLVEYAQSMLDGNWLGAYNWLTLAKKPGYSLILWFTSVTGIPYQVFFIGIYVLGCYLFVRAVRPLVESYAIRCGMYVVLLYLPVLFARDIFQRVYRMGIVIPFVMLALTCYIALYLRRNERLRSLVPWSVVAALSLAVFYLIKEDSAWILPFVATVSVILAIYWLYALRKKRRSPKGVLGRYALLVLPLAGMVCGSMIVGRINYERYGTNTVCERYDSAFSDATSLLVSIDDPKADHNVWMPRSALDAALACSPTLRSIEPQIEESWDYWSGGGTELVGDLSFWSLLDAFGRTGKCVSGSATTEFWGKVASELKAAFDDGRLQRKPGFKISASTQPITVNDLGFLLRTARYRTAMLFTLRMAEVSYELGNGSLDLQQSVGNMTHGCIALRTGREGEEAPNKWALDADALILRVQKVLARPMVLVMLLVVLYAVYCATKGRQANARHALLISFGLVLNALVLVVAVTWFTVHLGDNAEWAAFMYCAGFYPLVAMASCLLAGVSLQDAVRRIPAWLRRRANRTSHT